MKLEGAVFVVTGGASGIGEQTVRMAIANGGKAAIWDMSKENGDKLVAELGADKALFHQINLLSANVDEEVDAAVAATVAKFGRIDCCVNSAGMGAAVATVNKKGNTHALKDFARIIQLNLIGSFICGSRCAGQMYKQEPSPEGERGLIVNISSIAAFDGQNGQAAYSASKAGVVGMTLPMARDMGKFGIRVNTICPGIVDTPMGGVKDPEKAGQDRDPEKMHPLQKGLLSAQIFPNRRFARPSEMANLVKFMAETSFMNGETVRLDAGSRMPKL